MEAVNNTTVDVITMVTYLFFIYLILAIFIERCVELIIGTLNYADQKLGWYHYWNKLAVRHQKRLDELYNYQGDRGKGTNKLFTWILWDVVIEKAYEGGKDIISAASIRFKYFRVISRIIAFFLSLAFALYIQKNLGVDLITLFENVSGIEMAAIGSGLKAFLTAVLLSVGSEPLHEIITKVELIGKDKSQKVK